MRRAFYASNRALRAYIQRSRGPVADGRLESGDRSRREIVGAQGQVGNIAGCQLTARAEHSATNACSASIWVTEFGRCYQTLCGI
jgi:hypothetical protein